MGPGSIEILEHTADVGFRVSASGLEELFRASARALIALIIEPSGLRAERTQNIRLDAGEPERLLFLWLNELLFLLDARDFIPAAIEDFRIDRMGEDSWRLEGCVRGDTLDRARHEYKTYVKAVTFHRLRIEKSGSGYVCEFYVDV